MFLLTRFLAPIKIWLIKRLHLKTRMGSSYQNQVTFILVWAFIMRVLPSFLIWSGIYPLHLPLTAVAVQEQDDAMYGSSNYLWLQWRSESMGYVHAACKGLYVTAPVHPSGRSGHNYQSLLWGAVGKSRGMKFLDLRRKEDAVPDIFTVILYLKTVAYRGKFRKEDGLWEVDKGFLSALWLQEGLGAMCSLGRGLQSRACCWPSCSTQHQRVLPWLLIAIWLPYFNYSHRPQVMPSWHILWWIKRIVFFQLLYRHNPLLGS